MRPCDRLLWTFIYINVYVTGLSKRSLTAWTSQLFDASNSVELFRRWRSLFSLLLCFNTLTNWLSWICYCCCKHLHVHVVSVLSRLTTLISQTVCVRKSWLSTCWFLTFPRFFCLSFHFRHRFLFILPLFRSFPLFPHICRKSSYRMHGEHRELFSGSGK